MKKCTNCGTENLDNAKFCATCGSALVDNGVEQLNGNVSAGSSNKFKFKFTKYEIIGMSAAALIIALVCIVGFSLSMMFFGNDYKKVAKNFLDGMSEFDSEKIVNSISKDIYKEFGATKRETLKEIDMALDDYIDDGYKFNCTITEYERFDKEDLSDYKEEYEDNNLNVTDGYTVYYDLVISDGSRKQLQDRDLKVLKVNGKWTIDVEDFVDAVYR